HCQRRKPSLRFGAGPDVASSRESAWRAEGALRTSPLPFSSGARRPPDGDVYEARFGGPGSGHLARVDQQLALLNLILIFKQATLRRSGGARTVRIVNATMAGAHE